MMESWNNGQKRITSVFGSRALVRLCRIGVNFYSFSINSELFKSSVDIFSIHGLFIPSTVLFFNQMEHERTQYSIIPLFHYSPPPADERSELSSFFNVKRVAPLDTAESFSRGTTRY